MKKWRDWHESWAPCGTFHQRRRIRQHALPKDPLKVGSQFSLGLTVEWSTCNWSFKLTTRRSKSNLVLLYDFRPTSERFLSQSVSHEPRQLLYKPTQSNQQVSKVKLKWTWTIWTKSILIYINLIKVVIPDAPLRQILTFLFTKAGKHSWSIITFAPSGMVTKKEVYFVEMSFSARARDVGICPCHPWSFLTAIKRYRTMVWQWTPSTSCWEPFRLGTIGDS